MDKNYDILISEEGDILFTDQQQTELLAGDAGEQHLRMILESNPGDFKLYPTVGAGLINYIKSHELPQALPGIKQQLEADGFTVTHLSLKDGDISVEAKR